MNIKVEKKYINIYKLFFEKLKEYGWTGTYEYELEHNGNGNSNNNGNGNDNGNDNGNSNDNTNNNSVNNNIITVKIIGSETKTLDNYLEKYKYMDYDLVEEMIVYLGSQLTILHKHSLGFLVFYLKHISVLDGKYFIFNSFDELCKLDNNENLMCNFPIDIQKNEKNRNNIFIAPELKNNMILPIITNITSSYYSFGLLCVRSLGIDDADDLNLNLNTIYNSRIYYFLKRCLENDPNKRYFIYL